MGLKLIGAGLGRTGTLSLKVALEQLGFGPCYHMTELFIHPDHAALWVGAAEGHPQWDRLLEGYVSSVDYPGCTFWRELAQRFPAAKVLLSVRDPEKWFQSTQETIFAEPFIEPLDASPLKPFFDKTVWPGIRARLHDRDFMVERFERHNAEVVRAIPPERLLVYDVRQGWPPLCQFLGVPVPEHAFPRANTREDFLRRRAELADADRRGDLETRGRAMREALTKLRQPR